MFQIYCISGTISALLEIIIPGNSSLLAVEQEGCSLADGSVRHLKQQLFKSIWGFYQSVSFFATHILVSGFE